MRSLRKTKFLLFLLTLALVGYFFVSKVYSQNQLDKFYYYDARGYFFNRFIFEVERDCGNPSSTRCDLNDSQSYYPHKSFGDLVDDYDTLVFLESVQGLVNRSRANFFISHHDTDEKWLSELPQKNVWLTGTTKTQLQSIDNVISTFKTGYGIQGSVVWDVSKPYTLNIAASVAGADRLVIVRKNSPLYAKITAAFPVKLDLVSQNLATKKVAYEWVVNNYLKPGKINPTLAYLKDGWGLKPLTEGRLFYSKDQLDGWGLMSINGVIKHKALDFDLAPSNQIRPPDEPNQPAGQDVQTFSYLLDQVRSLTPASKMVEFWGFPTRKYKQDCNHDGRVDEGDFVVCGEWATQTLISSKGAVMRGAGGGDIYGVDFSNSSFWEWGPKVDFIPQSAPLTPAQLISKGYLTGNANDINSLKVNTNKKFVLMYLGDYDFSHPLYSFPVGTNPFVWQQRTAGLPVAWGFVGDSQQIIAPLYAYYAKTKNASDYFVMPDSGNGYLNPGDIPTQYINSWITDATSKHRQINYRAGWVLNGSKASDVTANNSQGAKIRNMYKIISPEGIFYNGPSDGATMLDGDLAVLPMADLSFAGKDAAAAANDLQSFTSSGGQFFVFRNIFVSPDYVSSVVNQANISNLAVVDPFTFFNLFKAQRGQKPVARMSVLSTTLPDRVQAGQNMQITLKIRNDGWEKWPLKSGVSCDGSATASKGCYNLGVVLQKGDITPTGPGKTPTVNYGKRVPISQAVAPGAAINLTFSLTAPQEGGRYTFQVDIVKEGYHWGETVANQPWQKKIVVTTTVATCDKKTVGDANCDEKIDTQDFELWRRQFLATQPSPTEIADFNNDSRVDLADFEVWRRGV